MADEEIYSFIGKFKYLCAAGFKAALELKSDHGCVCISLTSNVGLLSPPTNQPPPTSFQRKYRHCRGPSYERRQQRRKANLVLKRREGQTVATNEGNPTVSSTNQAEKLATVPCANEEEELAVDLEVLPSEENISQENPPMKASAAAEADNSSCLASPPSSVSETLISSSKAIATTEDFIIKRIQSYASQFAKPEYLYPTYEPTCCQHHHVPGRGGHNVPKDGSQCCFHRCRMNPHYLLKKPDR